MSLLECAEIRNRFGIDSSALDAIEHLIESARVRWGISAQQRRELGLPGIHENTWQQAWERIFAGYAMPGDDLWQQTAPLSEVDSDNGIAIARFRYLFERLVYWRQQLTLAASTSVWQQRLHQLIDEFLAATMLPMTCYSRCEMSSVTSASPTLANSVRHWSVTGWKNSLATNQQAGRLYSGGITFCGMQPMRNIPFAVICVLGMQDNAFPRRERAAEFDLMRNNWRPGTRTRETRTVT